VKMVKILAIFLVYFISGKLGLQLASINPSATAIWPPTGIAIASFLLFGYRITPAIFLGAFFVNSTITGFTITSLGIALGNTLEGIIAAYLVNKFANGLNAFDKVTDILKYTILAAILSTMVSATFGVTTLLLSGLTTLHSYFSVWITWWLGDAGGALIIGPLFIIWAAKRDFLWKRREIYETFFLMLALAAIAILVFYGLFPFPYLCFPVLILLALRRDRQEVTAAIFLLCAIAAMYTLYGLGPFAEAGKTANESLLLLQLFMGTISVTTLIVAAIVSGQKKGKEVLEESQRYFKSLIEKSFHAIILINRTGNITYVNSSTKKVLGYNSGEFIGRRIFKFVHPNDIPYVTGLFGKLFKNPGKSIVMKYRFQHKNGSFIWLEGSSTNLLKDKAIGGIVISFRDVTDQKHAEELKEKMATIVNASHDAIFTETIDGIVTSWNKGAEKVYCYKASEIIGKSISITFPKDRMHELKQMINTIKQKEYIDNYEAIRIRKDGVLIYLSMSISAKKDKSGRAHEVSVIARDITHEKDLERQKDEFISMAGHELNTPITAISVYSQTLQKHFDKKLDQESGIYLSKMNDQIRRIQRLIRDLLDISRIRLGILTFNYIRFNINTLVKEIVEVFQYVSKKRIIQIVGHEDKAVFGDRDRIGQVLTNLLSNAIKYSGDNTKVIVKISSDEKEVILAVQDFGIGIARKKKEKIFERFYRVQSHDKTLPGLGIGLYISFQIVEQHKGKMWVESTKGKGSTFYFSLPLKRN